MIRWRRRRGSNWCCKNKPPGQRFAFRKCAVLVVGYIPAAKRTTVTVSSACADCDIRMGHAVQAMRYHFSAAASDAGLHSSAHLHSSVRIQVQSTCLSKQFFVASWYKNAVPPHSGTHPFYPHRIFTNP
jgi:hypothetical protein